MDKQAEDLFRRLAGEFDAALAADDERAAGDLAHSLANGRDIRSLIAGGSRVLLPSGGAADVATLAGDHCACGPQGDWLVPLAAAEVVIEAGRRPERSREGLVPVLRRLASRRPQVEVFASAGRRTGALLGAGADHLRMGTVAGLLAVPVASVRAVRLVRGG